jgi:hypothetical protein
VGYDALFGDNLECREDDENAHTFLGEEFVNEFV